MVDWDSQADPVAMAVSVVVVVATGALLAGIGATRTESLGVVSLAAGGVAAAVAVAAQAWLARHRGVWEELTGSRWARGLLGATAGIAGVVAVRAVPAATVGFGAALVVFGPASRLYLYRRAAA